MRQRGRVAIRENFLINPPSRLCLPSFVKHRRRNCNPLSIVGLAGLSNPIIPKGMKFKSKAGIAWLKYNREAKRHKGRVSISDLMPVQKQHRVKSKSKKGGIKVAKMPKGLKWGSKKYMEELRSRRTFKKHRTKSTSKVRHKMEDVIKAVTRHRGRPKGSHNKKKGRGRPKGSHNVRHRLGMSPLTGYRVGSMRILTNPYRHRRRRNPAGILSMGAGLNLGSIAPLVITAGIAGVVTKLVPGFFGSTVLSNHWYRYGVQVASGVVGYYALDKFLNKEYARILVITAGAVVIMDLIQTYLLSAVATPAGTAGLGMVSANYKAGQYTYPGQVGAFTRGQIPGNISGVGAFTDPYHN